MKFRAIIFFVLLSTLKLSNISGIIIVLESNSETCKKALIEILEKKEMRVLKAPKFSFNMVNLSPEQEIKELTDLADYMNKYLWFLKYHVLNHSSLLNSIWIVDNFVYIILQYLSIKAEIKNPLHTIIKEMIENLPYKPDGIFYLRASDLPEESGKNSIECKEFTKTIDNRFNLYRSDKDILSCFTNIKSQQDCIDLEVASSRINIMISDILNFYYHKANVSSSRL